VEGGPRGPRRPWRELIDSMTRLSTALEEHLN